MERQSDAEINLFVRDEQTGHIHFNAKALRALGINPKQAQQCGYLLKDLPDAPDTAGTTASHITQPPR
jgi:hypothetical protein